MGAPEADGAAQAMFNKFQEAVRDGTKDDVLRSVQEAGFPVDFVSPTGRRPVHLIAERGLVAPLKHIAQAGADLFALDKKQASALHYAAKAGSTSCVQFLLDAGLPASGLPGDADANEVDTAFHWAVWGIKFDAAQALLEKDPGLVERYDKEGEAVLHWAVVNDRVAVAKKLVTQCGADANARSARGVTPLHYAAEMGNREVLTWLLEDLGVEPSPKDEHGDTPLHVAVSFEQDEVVALLLSRRGVDARARNENNQTPLELAEYLQVGGGIPRLLDAALHDRVDEEVLALERDLAERRRLAERVEQTRLAGGH